MRRAAALLPLATLATLAHAGPDNYVATPTVEYGERELEFRYGSEHGGDGESAGSIAFGYGVTTRWFTEVSAEFAREAGRSMRYDAVEWENKFMLTEPGEYFVHAGLLVELEYPRDRAEGYELRIGPLLQKDFGPVQANANVFLERHYRADADEGTELSYQWQVKYRFRPEFEFGLQGFGEVGRWNDWAPADEQEHTLGPALFGKVSLGGRQALRWNAAWLLGATRAAPDHVLRAQLEYEF